MRRLEAILRLLDYLVLLFWITILSLSISVPYVKA